jgi:predicted O-methyltransferase YrrM
LRTPPLVTRVEEVADALGLSGSGGDGAGPLLHVLAAGRGVRRAAEIGPGVGVGTAWIASALRPGVPLFTVEADSARALVARELFLDDPDLIVVAGNWREVLVPEAPFDFISVGSTQAKDGLDGVLALAAPQATVVLGDSPADRTERDVCREEWLGHPRLDAVVIGTGDVTQAIVAVVRG